jgi:hypothetical protein
MHAMNHPRLLPFAMFVVGAALSSSVAHAEEAVCVRVKLEIPQTLTLERDAFDARLGLTNNLPDVPLTDLRVDLVFRAQDGSDAASQFFVQAPRLTQVTGAVDGTGVIAGGQRGEVQWLLVPVPGAGGALPGGRSYAVRAHIEYRAGGLVETIDTVEDVITVKPQPELQLRYFLPRNVRGDDPFTPELEPSVPFELGVRVQNVGFGPARALQIDSAQPQITENDRGAILEFRLIGTFRDDQSIPPTLSIPFGDLAPARCGMGAWAMTTSLQGRFVDLDVTFHHADELGGDRTSLLRPPQSDFLVHRVLIDSVGRDGVFDALIDDLGSNDGTPDRVLESSCGETPVTATTGTATLRGDQTTLLSGPVSIGWNWVKAPDPEQGRFAVAGAVRVRDGKTLPALNAWTDVDDAGAPFVVVFDESTAGGVTEQWALRYDRGGVDVTPPVTTAQVLPPFVAGTPVLIGPATPIVFSATDDASGVASTVVSIDGGPFELARTLVLSTPGPHTLRFRSNDRRGNTEADQTLAVIVDDAAPVVTLSSPAAGGRFGNDAPLPVAFSVTDDDPGATVAAWIAPSTSSDPERDGVPVRSGDVVAAGQLAPGAWVVVFDVADRLDHRARLLGGTFVVEDRTTPGPTITVRGVEDGRHYRGAITPVVDFNGVQLEVASVAIDDTPFASGSAFAAEGTHLLTARAVDSVGRTATASVLFTIDTVAPAVTVGVIDDGLVADQPLTPFADVFDDNLFDVVVTLDDAPWPDGAVVDSDGVHVYRVSASDLAGNETTVAVRFTIDRAAPRFVVEGASDGAVLAAPTVLSVRVIDDSLVASEVRLDGALYDAATTVGRGVHTVTANARDRLGRTATLSLSFTVDPEPPVVRVSGVAAGTRVRGPVVPVVAVEDDTAVDVTTLLDGADFLSGTSVAAFGDHLLVVRAVDAAGHVTNVELAFVLDATLANLDITGVDDGASYPGPVTPVVTTDADSTLALTLDGGPFVSGAVVDGEGEHVLVAEATAATPGGPVARGTVRFSIDRTAPTLFVAGVVDGGVYAEAITPVVSAADERLAQVLTTLDGFAFVEGTPIDAPGDHLLVVTARDRAGNEARVELAFAIDPSVPVLTLVGATDGALVRGPVAVDAVVRAPGGGPFEGTLVAVLDGQDYVLGSAIAADGPHDVRVTATPTSTSDNGRSAVAGLRFTSDATAPTVLLSGVVDGAVTAEPVTLLLDVTDDRLDPATVVFVVDGVAVAVQPGATPAARTTIDAEGDHVAEATAFDVVGNRASQRRTFAIDRTPPLVVIDGVVDGASVTGSVTPVVTVTDRHLRSTTTTLDGADFAAGAAITTPGPHVLVVTANDDAGLQTVVTVTFTIVEPAALATWDLHVTRQGAAATGARVFLLDEAGAAQGRSVVVDGDGHARFDGLSPGRYRARIDWLWQRHLVEATAVVAPVTALAVALPDESAAARVWHVDAAAAADGDGTPDLPFSDVGEALVRARFGDAVRVAGGVYAGPVALVDGVSVRGGYDPLARDDDGNWRADPATQPTVLQGAGGDAGVDSLVVQARGLSTAVLADVAVVGGRLVVSDASVLVVDVVLREGASIDVAGASDSLLANLLVTGAPDPAVRVVDSAITLASSTIAGNAGAGVVVQGGAVALRQVIFADNGAAAVVGAPATVVEVLDDRATAGPTFVAGPLHDRYLAQIVDGAPADSAGVDAAGLLAAALDLRGRTTSPRGRPDDGALDLGYHAWPVAAPPPPPDDAGPGDVDAGNDDVDAGNNDVDAGNNDVDAGNNDVDAGNNDVDAGNNDVDAGNNDVDAGNNDVDAGNNDVDAGNNDVDAGNNDVDAGNNDVDAGDPDVGDPGDAAEPPGAAGCEGCTTGSAGSWALVGVLLAVRRRRRTRADDASTVS